MGVSPSGPQPATCNLQKIPTVSKRFETMNALDFRPRALFCFSMFALVCNSCKCFRFDASLHTGSSFGQRCFALFWRDLFLCFPLFWKEDLPFPRSPQSQSCFDRAIKQKISELNCPKEEPVCRLIWWERWSRVRSCVKIYQARKAVSGSA